MGPALHHQTTYYWQIVAKNASGWAPGPVWWFHTAKQFCVGDLNCDGVIDFGDVSPFVLALSNWQAWKLKYPDCPPENTDINGDKIFGGVVGGANDINAFVDLLAWAGGQSTPCE